jgi:hypothetical protein
VHVAREKGLKIEDYTLRVFRDGNGITVLFSSRETSAAIKGALANQASKSNWTVICVCFDPTSCAEHRGRRHGV